MNENNGNKSRELMYFSVHRTCEKSQYEAEKDEEPIAQISTRVTKKAFLDCCAVVTRGRINAEALLALIAVLMVAVGFFSLGKYGSEFSIWLVLLACGPLGAATALELKRKVSSPENALKRREALVGTSELTADITFYSDELTYHDPAEDGRRFRQGLVVIPYDSFRRIVITDEAAALIDRSNYAVTAMREDIPDWLMELLKEKCLSAKVTDRSVKV